MKADMNVLSEDVAMPTIADCDSNFLTDSEEVEDGFRGRERHSGFSFRVRLSRSTISGRKLQPYYMTHPVIRLPLIPDNGALVE